MKALTSRKRAAGNDSAKSSGSKIIGVGIRMELHSADAGGRELYFEFRRDLDCKRVFFWSRLKDVLLERGFDIKGGSPDEEWAAVPFHHGIIAGSHLAASKGYKASEVDGIKRDVQAMFDLWADADIKDMTSEAPAGREASPDTLDAAMMYVA